MITQHEDRGGTWSQEKGRPWKKRTVAGVMALTRWSGIAFGSCLRKVGCFGLLSIIATRKPLVMAELAAISQHRNQRNQNLYTSWNLHHSLKTIATLENAKLSKLISIFLVQCALSDKPHLYQRPKTIETHDKVHLQRPKNNLQPYRRMKIFPSSFLSSFVNVRCMISHISTAWKIICKP
jgi:hypothetical protein